MLQGKEHNLGQCPISNAACSTTAFRKFSNRNYINYYLYESFKAPRILETGKGLPRAVYSTCNPPARYTGLVLGSIPAIGEIPNLLRLSSQS